jgi:hypothetical protein
LLDALERLETVDRRFQQRSRMGRIPRGPVVANTTSNGNGKRKEVLS